MTSYGPPVRPPRPKFETKDSGQHAEYASGMRRDSQEGKPYFGLILTKLQPYEEQMLTRYAALLARGAVKYDARNWENGDSEEELERAKESLLRHTIQLLAGETDEDHAAAVWFNTQAVEYFRWRIARKNEIPAGSLSADMIIAGVSSPALEIHIPTIDASKFTHAIQTQINRTKANMARLHEPPRVIVGSSDEETELDEGEIARQKHRDSLHRWHNRSVGAVDRGNFGE